MPADAIVFLVSQVYLSRRRFDALARGLAAATPVPCRVVRMEGTGSGLTGALDALAAGGASAILVQPVGLPFSDSLSAWLPGALAEWRRGADRPGLLLRIGADQCADDAILARLAARALDGFAGAAPVDPETGSASSPGWDEVPPFRHHLLVCTGPRCNYRRSGPLQAALSAEIARQRLSRDCLIATTGCLFPCNRGPVVAHYPAGRWYRLGSIEDIALFVSAVLRDGRSLPHLIIHEVSS